MSPPGRCQTAIATPKTLLSELRLENERKIREVLVLHPIVVCDKLYKQAEFQKARGKGTCTCAKKNHKLRKN